MFGTYTIRSYKNTNKNNVDENQVTGDIYKAYNAAFNKSLETEVDAVVILANGNKHLSEIGLKNVGYKSGNKIMYSRVEENSNNRIKFIL